MDLFRENEILHKDESLLQYNYKVQDLVWLHIFSHDWVAEYSRANLSILIEYSETNPYVITVKLSGSAGDNVKFKVTKTVDPSAVIDPSVYDYVLKLVAEAKYEIEESI